VLLGIAVVCVLCYGVQREDGKNIQNLAYKFKEKRKTTQIIGSRPSDCDPQVHFGCRAFDEGEIDAGSIYMIYMLRAYHKNNGDARPLSQSMEKVALQ